MKSVRIILKNIESNEQLHNEFSKVMGFPEFYGRNWDAWIDCMSCIDVPKEEMTKIHVNPGDSLILELQGWEMLESRLPDLSRKIVACTAFVNDRLARTKTTLLLLVR